MYKMLVVDDEYLVLMGIRETIDWAKYDIEIVGEASNGLMGFELAMKLKPDIIISDVKMPLLNGLGLVEKLKEASFDGAIVILSGYKDFEYAKQAFENGVYSYVLKPIDNNELVDIVVKVLKKLDENRKNIKLYDGLKEQIPVIKSKIFRDIIDGKLLDSEKIDEQLKLFSINLVTSGFVIYGRIDDNEEKLAKEALKKLYLILLENLYSLNVNLNDELFDDYFVILVSSNNINHIQSKCQLSMNQYEKEYDNIFSLGISNHYKNISEINVNYLIAQNVAKNKLFAGLNSITFSDEVLSNYKKNIIAALEIIAAKFATNLTVGMVADELYVSESYLMHLFKDNLGKTFNECLTSYRIMYAKKLLRSGKYRINEIAEMVGYGDVKYFGQVFRKQVGCTPSDFIKDNE